MPIKYLCIDDDNENNIHPYLEMLRNTNPELEITSQKPKKDIGEQLSIIREFHPDGLMIDLRLDQNRNDEGKIVPFRGQTLSQELRTRMAEKEILPCPILLWTVDRNVDSYNRDDSSHDLYDLTYIKDKRIIHEPQNVAIEMIALAKGYSSIENAVSCKQLLSISNEERTILDSRMTDSIESKIGNTHACAKFILGNLILYPGPLIGEKLLGARLGIDIERSNDWSSFVGNLPKNLRYEGVFNEAWPRWWMGNINQWWKNLPDSPGPLQRLTAPDRVKFIKQIFGLSDLVPSAPIVENYSQRFWTVCLAYDKPLDPIDGIMATETNNSPWLDTPYLSFKSVLERDAFRAGYRINPLEIDRFNDLKESLKEAN